MNSLFATGLGLSVRVGVDAVSPYNFRIGASVVGLCEGIILYNSRPGISPFNPSLNPYTAYGLRIVIDYLWTQSFVRIAIILLWTGLGLVLSDTIQASSSYDHHRSAKTRSERTRKSRSHHFETLPPLDDELSPDITLPSGFPDSISAMTPLPVDGLDEPDLPPTSALSEIGIQVTPGPLPVMLRSLSSISDFLRQDSGGDDFPAVPSPNRYHDTPAVFSGLDISTPTHLDHPIVRPAPSDNYRPPTTNQTPALMIPPIPALSEPLLTTDSPTPLFPIIEPLLPNPFEENPTPSVPSNLDAPPDVSETVPPNPLESYPTPPTGVPIIALGLTPPQITLTPPPISQSLTDIPMVLIPGVVDSLPMIDKSLSFIPSPDSTPLPVPPPTTEPIQATTEGPTVNETADTIPSIVVEHVDPLSASATETIPAEKSSTSPPPVDNTPQADDKGERRWNRATLTVKARNLKSQAANSVKDYHRFEAERKKAVQEGRKKDSILREGDRDAAAAKARLLSEKAAKYYYHADNLDLPPQTIDIHHSNISRALQVIKDKYRQTLKNGDKPLRVIMGREASSKLKTLPTELRKHHIPCNIDPADAGVLILPLPP